jgi:putative nucleotidyltransferase with HDIG domain
VTKIQTLEKNVRRLYADKNPDRADWADWLGENHVFLVADNAAELADRFGTNGELARAGGLLHDIADATMGRFANSHEEANLEIARDLMQKTGFGKDEVTLTVDDALRYHGCQDGHIPSSIEGKILATADALAHLQTDFYLHAIWAMGKEEKSLNSVKDYVLKKNDRDFNDKILFNEIKDECRKDYERLRVLFSR